MDPAAQEDTANAAGGTTEPAGVIGRLLFPIGIVAVAFVLFKTFSAEKEKQQHPKPPGRVLKTQVIELARDDFQTTIRTQGVVRPHNEASITTQVAGKVKTVAELLHDGAFFKQGEILLEIDDQDFKGDVVSAEAELARADALHAQEQAKANQARLNWEELGYDEEPNDLVLRLPQLREAEANVKAAQAGLDRAKRDLERTVVRAPFNGRVLQRSVAIGQSVNPGTELAKVYNTTFVEVRLPVAARELAFLSLPESASQPPVEIVLSDALDSESEARWSGQIVGTEGALDPGSRELFAIARIHDPFSRLLPPEERGAPLRIGQPVRAEIPGKILKDVIAIPRSAVRQLNRIYLVDREALTLDRREIEELWSDAEHIVVRDPSIRDRALLATSRLVYAPNVSKVEILPDDPEPEPDPEPAPEAEPVADTAAKK